MANIYDSFLGLIPTYPVLIGTVVSVVGEQHTLELIGGGVIVCHSQKLYEVGKKVYTQDLMITSEAPDNEVQQFRV